MRSYLVRFSICIIGLMFVTGCNRTLDYKSDHFEYNDIFNFYSRQGPVTNPGKYEFLYEDLPDDPNDLVDVVQGLLISEGLSYAAGIKEEDIRRNAYDLTRIEDILRRIYKLDKRSLTIARLPEERLLGVCSNFSALYCSFLRYKNIPARVRSGYQAYSSKDKFVNHYVCEYWDAEGKKWIPVDSEIPKHITITLDNFSRQEEIEEFTFITAGYAWRLARMGLLDPQSIGLGSSLEWESFGWDMLRPGVYSDFMALNKFEMHPWDVPKIWDSDDRLALEFIDSIAQYNKKDDYFHRRTQLFKSEKRLQLP